MFSPSSEQQSRDLRSGIGFVDKGATATNPISSDSDAQWSRPHCQGSDRRSLAPKPPTDLEQVQDRPFTGTGNSNAKHPCPFYMFDRETHSKCREHESRNIADVFYHIKRTHFSEIFCARCWMQFKSQKELDTHSRFPIQCGERPFHYGWTRQEDLDAVSDLRKNSKNTDKKKPRWVGVEWIDIFNTLFPGARPRERTFRTAKFQDVADTWSEFTQSPGYQNLVRSFATSNEPPGFVALMISDSFSNFLREKDQMSTHSGPASYHSPRADSYLGSSSSFQGTPVPFPAQQVFSETGNGNSSTGLDDQFTIPLMSTYASPSASNPTSMVLFPQTPERTFGNSISAHQTILAPQPTVEPPGLVPTVAQSSTPQPAQPLQHEYMNQDGRDPFLGL